MRLAERSDAPAERVRVACRRRRQPPHRPVATSPRTRPTLIRRCPPPLPQGEGKHSPLRPLLTHPAPILPVHDHALSHPRRRGLGPGARRLSGRHGRRERLPPPRSRPVGLPPPGAQVRLATPRPAGRRRRGHGPGHLSGCRRRRADRRRLPTLHPGAGRGPGAGGRPLAAAVAPAVRGPRRRRRRDRQARHHPADLRPLPRPVQGAGQRGRAPERGPAPHSAGRARKCARCALQFFRSAHFAPARLSAGR